MATFIIACKQVQNPEQSRGVVRYMSGSRASAIPDMSTAVGEERGSHSRAGETVDALGADSRRCKWAAEAWREAKGVSINVA